MGATSLEVALPKALEACVSERVAEGGYSSPGDYSCALIRADQEQHARAMLDRLLLEGLDSEPDHVTPEYLAGLRREAKERIESRRKRV
ncbi:MAG: type II toxin-antitoxin system ParD family antitoxin [Geminicoccaceae bacterium]